MDDVSFRSCSMCCLWVMYLQCKCFQIFYLEPSHWNVYNNERIVITQTPPPLIHGKHVYNSTTDLWLSSGLVSQKAVDAVAGLLTSSLPFCLKLVHSFTWLPQQYCVWMLLYCTGECHWILWDPSIFSLLLPPITGYSTLALFL